MTTVKDVKVIEFKSFSDPNGTLTVYESGDRVPFDMKRVFCIDTKISAERGHHAHHECSQLLVALRGKIDVVVDDGVERKTFPLTTGGRGLLLPPGIWGEQNFGNDSLLMVLTDRIYEESDYIRDRDAFLKYKKDGK